MRNWINLFENIDPRWREVSAYIRDADAAEQSETIAAVLQAAGLDGWGGHCFVAAVAINNALFGGEGKLVGAYNTTLMKRDARFTGHLAVLFDGIYWDSDGRPKQVADIESWGMLDSDDPDYDLTPEEAEHVTVTDIDPTTAINMAKARGDDVDEWEQAIYRAVGQTFEFD